MVWMRTLAPVEADPLLHDAILAFASDYTPFEPILRRQGLSWMTPGLRMATIDHAIWWHRHVDANEWLLYVQRSPSAAGGRGLTHGQVFDRAGDLRRDGHPGGHDPGEGPHLIPQRGCLRGGSAEERR